MQYAIHNDGVFPDETSDAGVLRDRFEAAVVVLVARRWALYTHIIYQVAGIVGYLVLQDKRNAGLEFCDPVCKSLRQHAITQTPEGRMERRKVATFGMEPPRIISREKVKY